MILLFGLPADSPMAMVHAELVSHKEAVVLVDQREILNMEVDVVFGRKLSGTLRVGETSH